MSQTSYEKHTRFFLTETDTNNRGLTEMQMVLREIQQEQLRQDEEMQQMASELRQTSRRKTRQDDYRRLQEREFIRKGKEKQQDPAIARQHSRAKETIKSNATQVQQTDRKRSRVTSRSINPMKLFMLIPKNIVVAGGGSRSYEVFDRFTQQWTLHKDTLFFDHNDAFSFLYEKKTMICGGTDTNRVECLDITNNRFASTFRPRLPDRECGKGVRSGHTILTFGNSVSATSLTSPFKTTVLSSYNGREKLSSYGVARINENAIALVGGYTVKSGNETSDHVHVFNPITKRFKRLAPLPYSAADMAVLVYKDNLVILGGMRSYYENSPAGRRILKSESLNGVLMYNITNQQCRKMPSMLQKRSRCTAVIIGETIVVFGGNSKELQSDSSLNLKTAEYLVLGEDKWKKLPPMHCERAGATACVQPTDQHVKRKLEK